MRARVERLLAAYERSEEVFEAPISPDIERELARLKPEEEGDTIGPYKLREKLGEGGFGTVWVADQERPVRRRVALKIIKMGMDTKEVIGRFEQERQALALMDHPNIAKVFDAGATQFGRPFFVMELVHGIPITQYCDENKLATPERLGLFTTVCQAVQHAHQKGIIHRDIKPSNVLVTVSNGVPVPKVIDFGVAKATLGRLTDRTIHTQLAQMIGTPLYMSPEQAAMSPLDVDTRSDIYSLGVLLYELLVGRTPFDSESVMKAGLDEMRRVIREQDPPKPSTAIQTMPANDRATAASCRRMDGAKMAGLLRGDLDWIVMKALEKARTRRYATATGFAEDIGRYLANEPVVAAAPGAIYRLRKFARRNRVIFAAGSAVVLTLIAGIAVSSWQRNRAIDAERVSGEERDRAKRALAETEIARKMAIAGEEKAKALVREASRSDAATAQARLAEGKWQEGVAYLGRAIRYDPDNQNARDALWLAVRYGKPDAGRLPIHSLEHKDMVNNAAFSPDGTRVVTASADQTAQVWNAKTGAPIGPSLRHAASVQSAAFSPDGSRVVTASTDTTARVWDATTGAPIGPPLKHEGAVSSAAFSPDGTRVVTASTDKTGRVWDATTGARIGVSLRHDGFVYSAAFSPDGTRVVTASSDKTARVWDARTGAPIGPPLSHEDTVRSAAFSPDGTRVVTASEDKTAQVWDATTGALIGVAVRHLGIVWTAAFSPDGTRVLTASEDHTARVWDVKTDATIGPDTAERLTAFLAGARLDPELGSLHLGSNEERMALWKTLDPALAALPDWRLAAEQAFSRDPQTALVSPRMSMTIRQAATSLIGTFNPATIREAAGIDPGHPLLPFAFALIESEKTATQPANPIRAAWLIDYGLKRLPADTSADDLRLAARYVAKVARSLPEQKPVAISLLDRAAQLTPDDEAAKALRAELEKGS